MVIIINISDIYIFIPELYLTLTVFILLIYGIFYSTNKYYGYPILSKNFGYLVVITFTYILFLIINTPDFLSTYFPSFFFSTIV
jgi:hypothetical protein